MYRCENEICELNLFFFRTAPGVYEIREVFNTLPSFSTKSFVDIRSKAVFIVQSEKK